MIIRDGTRAWGAVRVYWRQEWAALALVLTIGLLLASFPVIGAQFEATVFSAGIAAIGFLMVEPGREQLKTPLRERAERHAHEGAVRDPRHRPSRAPRRSGHATVEPTDGLLL